MKSIYMRHQMPHLTWNDPVTLFHEIKDVHIAHMIFYYGFLIVHRSDLVKQIPISHHAFLGLRWIIKQKSYLCCMFISFDLGLITNIA